MPSQRHLVFAGRVFFALDGDHVAKSELEAAGVDRAIEFELFIFDHIAFGDPNERRVDLRGSLGQTRTKHWARGFAHLRRNEHNFFTAIAQLMDFFDAQTRADPFKTQRRVANVDARFVRNRIVHFKDQRQFCLPRLEHHPLAIRDRLITRTDEIRDARRTRECFEGEATVPVRCGCAHTGAAVGG